MPCASYCVSVKGFSCMILGEMNTGTNSHVILVKSIPYSGSQLSAFVNVDLPLSRCFLNLFYHIQYDFCHIKITCILSTFCLNLIFFFNLTCFFFRFILSNSIHGIIDIYQCFSTRGDFDPQRTSGNVGDILGVPTEVVMVLAPSGWSPAVLLNNLQGSGHPHNKE